MSEVISIVSDHQDKDGIPARSAGDDVVNKSNITFITEIKHDGDDIYYCVYGSDEWVLASEFISVG